MKLICLITTGTLLLLWIAIPLYCFFRKKEEVKKGQCILRPLADILYTYFRKKGHGIYEKEKLADAIYIRKEPQKKVKDAFAKQIYCIWSIVFLCIIIIGFFAVRIVQEQPTVIKELERPTFGETKQYAVEVEGEGFEEAVTMTVTVDGKEPTEDEIQGVFDEVMERVKQKILGENESLETIRSDLNLFTTTDYGIRIVWNSTKQEYITNQGKVKNADVPKDGVLVTLCAQVSYGMYEYLYEINVCVLPPEEDLMYQIGQLKTLLKEYNDKNKTNGTIILPEKIGEYAVIFRSIPRRQPWEIILLIVAGGMFFIAYDKQRWKEAYEKRKDVLKDNYAPFIFRLSLLINCGMTMRSAWNHLLEGYLEKKTKTGYSNYLYEEMLTSQNQLKAGMGEAAVYQAFGQRCEIDSYIRLGNYLGQNVRQGAAGLQRMLEAEFMQALEEKKNTALQRGEVMNTRLLLPMFMMLGVVLLILMTPAFMML